MDMKIDGRTVQDVKVIPADFGGGRVDDSPEAKAAMKCDALVLEDADGKYYRAYKQGMYNKEEVYALRGTEVVIDGKIYKHVHNINERDTTTEKVGGAAGDVIGWLGFKAEMGALRVYTFFQNLMMGLASK